MYLLRYTQKDIIIASQKQLQNFMHLCVGGFFPHKIINEKK